MNNEKEFVEELNKLTYGELLAFIDSPKIERGNELLLAKRELKIRMYLNTNNRNKPNKPNNSKKTHIPFCLKFKLIRFDLQSVFICVISLSIGIGGFWFCENYTPKIDYTLYNTSTNGQIHNIKANTGFSHNADGSAIITNS